MTEALTSTSIFVPTVQTETVTPAQVSAVITQAGYTVEDFCTLVQSSRLLAMSETDIQRIRSVYAELNNKRLLAMFWSIFKNEMARRKQKPEWERLPEQLKDIQRWQVYNIRVVFDPNNRVLVVSMREDFQILTWKCDLYWNLTPSSTANETTQTFKRALRTLKRTGLKEEIEQAVATSGITH